MSGELVINAATEAEREWAAALMAGTDPWITLGRSLEHCRQRCRDSDYLLYVAHAGEQPCAFILLHRRGLAGSPYIATLAVAEAFRGTGVGTRMVAFAEQLFRGEARHIFLCVSSFNGRARSLYQRLGYTAVGELKEYVIPGASEILMHKRLA